MFFAVLIALLLNEFDLREREREREREKHQPKLMQLRSSLAVISYQGRGFPGCCPFLWFLGEGGGYILSCWTPINMWQLMRSKKDF
jgi:hypothetical protein